MRTRSFFLVGFLFCLTSFASAATAQAQEADARVVARLVEFGQMTHSDAGNLVALINSQLRANAARGGNDYDTIRQSIGAALFPGPNGGPGRTPAEYQQRLQRVIGVLRAGLESHALEALFGARTNAAALCASTFGVTMNSCDALIAAAAQRRAAVPYSPPDDGHALLEAVEHSGASRDLAHAVVEGVRRAMLGVPATLTQDARGHALIELLEACPGGLSSRESQLRAWHVGPTEGMARCLVESLARTNRGPALIEALVGIFRLERPAAIALASWVVPPPAPPPAAPPAPPPPPAATAVPPPPPPPPANSNGPMSPAQLTQLAQQQAQAGRLPAARALYEQAIEANANYGPAYAGLGDLAIQAHDGRLALRSYQRALDLLPRTAPPAIAAALFAGMGDAHAGLRAARDAEGAYRRALSIDGSNVRAQRGLASMGLAPPPPAPAAPAPGTMQSGTPPAPPPPPPPAAPALPEVPSRDQVVATLRPLQPGVHGCFPNRTGVIRFRIAAGNNGNIIDTTIAGGDFATEVAGSPEAECAINVVKSAHFPAFSRAEGFTVEYPFSL